MQNICSKFYFALCQIKNEIFVNDVYWPSDWACPRSDSVSMGHCLCPSPVCETPNTLLPSSTCCSWRTQSREHPCCQDFHSWQEGGAVPTESKLVQTLPAQSGSQAGSQAGASRATDPTNQSSLHALIARFTSGESRNRSVERGPMHFWMMSIWFTFTFNSESYISSVQWAYFSNPVTS